jgi:hypothetical protein
LRSTIHMARKAADQRGFVVACRSAGAEINERDIATPCTQKM